MNTNSAMTEKSVMANADENSSLKESLIRDSAIMVSEGSERNENTELQTALKVSNYLENS